MIEILYYCNLLGSMKYSTSLLQCVYMHEFMGVCTEEPELYSAGYGIHVLPSGAMLYNMQKRTHASSQ